VGVRILYPPAQSAAMAKKVRFWSDGEAKDDNVPCVRGMGLPEWHPTCILTRFLAPGDTEVRNDNAVPVGSVQYPYAESG
jgi:hypothetical protein